MLARQTTALLATLQTETSIRIASAAEAMRTILRTTQWPAPRLLALSAPASAVTTQRQQAGTNAKAFQDSQILD